MPKYEINFKFTNHCRKSVIAVSPNEAEYQFMRDPWRNWDVLRDVYHATSNEVISISEVSDTPQEDTSELQKYTVEFEFSPLCKTVIEADSISQALELFYKNHSEDSEWEYDSTMPKITKIAPVKKDKKPVYTKEQDYLIENQVLVTYEDLVSATSEEEAVKRWKRGDCDNAREVAASSPTIIKITNLTDEEN